MVSSPSSDSSFDYFSASSSPSYDVVSNAASDDSEQIVWTLSSLSLSISSLSSALISQAGVPRSPTTFSDEDIVVISRAHSPEPAAEELVEAVSPVAVSNTPSTASKKRSRRKRSVSASKSATSSASSTQSKSKPKAKPKNKKAVKVQGSVKAGSSPVAPQDVSAPQNNSKSRRKARRAAAAAVRAQSPASSTTSSTISSELQVTDDASESGDVPSLYERAVDYITS